MTRRKLFLNLIIAGLMLGLARPAVAAYAMSSHRATDQSSHLQPQAPTEPGAWDQSCQQSTWCWRGYSIWCSTSGATCDSDKADGSWVWCASYDEWGTSWESSDYCY